MRVVDASVIVELVAFDHIVMRDVPLERIDEHAFPVGIHRPHQCAACADIIAIDQAYHSEASSLEGRTVDMRRPLTLPRKGRIDLAPDRRG